MATQRLWMCLVLSLVSVSKLRANNNPDEIGIPPVLIKGPVESQIFRPDSMIALECIASGVPAPKYSWLFNGQVVELNLKRNWKMLRDVGTIEIENLEPFDQGYYQCRAENIHGVTLSRTTFLQMAVLDTSATSSSEIRALEATEGQPFTIPSFQPRSVPHSMFFWEIATGKLDPNSKNLIMSKRLQTSDTGELYFAYVQKEDELTGKIYKCLAFNPIMDVKSGGSYNTLKVNRSPNGLQPFKPVKAFSSPDNNIGVVGRSISLRCFFSGLPVPNLRWSKTNGQLPATRNKVEEYDTKLTIFNINEEDAGTYTCVGSNEVDSDTTAMELVVQVSPIFQKTSDGPINMNVTEGDSTVFNCNAYAKPAADIVWMKDGVILDINHLPDKMHISADKKSLIVCSVCRFCEGETRVSDLMVIQCNASNVHGYAFGSGYLNVLKTTSTATTSTKPVVCVSLSATLKGAVGMIAVSFAAGIVLIAL